MMKSGPSNDDDEDANTQGSSSSISHICGTSKKSSEGSAVLLPLPTDETLGLPSLPVDDYELTRRNRGDDNWQKGIGGLLWPLGAGTDVPATLLQDVSLVSRDQPYHGQQSFCRSPWT